MNLPIGTERLSHGHRNLVVTDISDKELERRRTAQAAKGWKPASPRKRKVSAALKAYAKLVTSADKGAVRNVDLLED